MESIASIKSAMTPNASSVEALKKPLSPQVGHNDPGAGPSFKDILSQQALGQADALKGAKEASILKFSNHALDRMQARGIYFDKDQLAKIEGALQKAASKGAKETLLLTDDSALIVSVKNNTVVTVMDKAGLRDNVFTNIDSAVMV
ncbi:MAG: hypothetical protein KDD22_08655 [Bdellovibrionales bacterium]|nr:hypothetical protein [Bdellovibrionales bacterium]